MIRLVLCILLMVPVAAQAQETVFEGAGFEARVTGKTLWFERLGQPYGAEEYRPGREVLWRFEGDQCERGRWYAVPREGPGEAICFEYETFPGPQCWLFSERRGRIEAVLVDDPPGTPPLVATRETETPLPCPGPDVGA